VSELSEVLLYVRQSVTFDIPLSLSILSIWSPIMPHPLTRKVLLIGWDAADWKIINPLLDAGKMPNLERMVNEGVMGNLATLYPALSPMLWTSIATGKRPFKHGIYGFTEPNPHGGGIRPVSSYSRTTRALWNMLHLRGMRSNVVGWWPSHPAEPINGVMVSNHFHRAVALMDQPWPLHEGTVHPPRLVEHLAKLRVHPQELDAGVIGLFVPEFDKIDQEKDHRLEGLAKTIAEAAGIQAAATALMQLEPWDFMGVYFDAIDHFCHGFMNYHPPRMEWVEEADFALFSGVVEAAYRYHDLMLGTLLELAGDETTVILISDHGFHPDHLRPRHIPVEPAGPAAQHRQHGILVMKGPGIKRDEIIHGASLLDIAPTILHLFGLPVGEDMDGTPLVNALSEPTEIAAIPSWDDLPGEDGSHPVEMQIDPVANREAIAQLVALGYIDKPADDLETALAETVRELDYDLARSYMDGGRYLDALPLLEKLTAQWQNS
jgi:predicted AlkP superfamily phosphohydrolase/phosphomutase